MACHTHTQTSLQFRDASDLVMKAHLTPLQRAEYFAATRQFDRALMYYDQVISQATVDEAAIRDMNRVVRSYLNVAVRVKQDPKTAFAFLTKVQGIPVVAEFYRRELAQWKKDLGAWMAERKPVAGRDGPALLAEGRRMVAQARRSQLYPADHSGDIGYLRATNALHEALEKGVDSPARAEAFSLLGASYEALSEPLLWDLGSLYFEACIRERPHTAQSTDCFKRLSNTIYLGYSGSSGVNVPEDQLKRLASLREMAHVK
jgi:hypothetical protein